MVICGVDRDGCRHAERGLHDLDCGGRDYLCREPCQVHVRGEEAVPVHGPQADGDGNSGCGGSGYRY